MDDRMLTVFALTFFGIGILIGYSWGHNRGFAAGYWSGMRGALKIHKIGEKRAESGRHSYDDR